MAKKVTRKRHAWIRHAVGASITLICLAAIAWQINATEVLDAIEHFHWIYLGWGICALAADYALRIFRWSIMLRSAGVSASFENCAAPFLGSITLNNILPLRLGDVVRALIFPRAMGATKTAATSSLVMERLIDLMTLLLCLTIGLSAASAAAIPPSLVTTAITMAVVGGLMLSFGFLFSGKLAQFFERFGQRTSTQVWRGLLSKTSFAVSGLLGSFEAMSRPKVLAALLAISMLIWIGEAGLFYFVLLGFGVEAKITTAVLVMALATLSTLIPSSPGYIGPFHLAAFFAISLTGGSTALAGSYAVLVHLALWLPTTIVGAIAMWASPALFSAARSDEGMLVEKSENI
ncbi:lysylphosphatidylglycerol synthase transmembrane domain-containing protein [Rhizobium sp. CNPSo 3464]|uniref:lysylphosphatidylglycerol synthase transmembrane domain-containing protein n=1 Tax=Rhizobium sp. CNPSo 3464 TaxID=3021406 RepID=UPI00254CFB67|nr:lysylphosphatidylglycerol synthase transmembrane domain-containing protein [Rhizobium sp. CNPSo 3464]MDK4743670.1 lysylphosphatidylglycerol synthase transmembrane domain-containing protein [Rhizobium sp. CNPSo 3464]